jgi:hypothetical protein
LFEMNASGSLPLQFVHVLRLRAASERRAPLARSRLAIAPPRSSVAATSRSFVKSELSE